MNPTELNAMDMAAVLASSKVLVVGDVMLDRYFMGDVFRISPEAPVPILQVMEEETRPGGAANVAMNIKALGGQVSLQSIVGRDAAGEELSRLLKQAGISAQLLADEGLRTTMKWRLVARSQQMLRADFEDRPGEKALAILLEHFSNELLNHQAVLISDYAKGALVDVQRMISLAKQKGLKVLVDPKGSDFSKYKGADLITPNRQELMHIIGPWQDEDQLRMKVTQLCESLEIQSLVLTRAEEGMTLFEPGHRVHLPAQQVEIADVTGAGDTVIAVLAMLLASDVPLVQAMALANRAGGLVVAKFGTATLSAPELLGA
ncbi:D-glycero-beta-D-manno-heptose-7-phosphate kinase [Limnohabitans sp. DCL3]|uniref:D-glycero-beta-D-manno-heptose-7-phosphate kinase n=1 Tax=Limnohabitans sp. DCL3 TaxID=3374103 RepID=UPI003A8B2361